MNRSRSAASDPLEEPSPLQPFYPLLILFWLVVFTFLFYTSILPNQSTAADPLYRLMVLQEVPGVLWESYLGEAPRGSLSLGQLLAQRGPILLLAFLMHLGAFSLGRLVLRSLRLLQQLDRVTSTCLAWGLGLSLLSLLTLACGLAGWLSRVLFMGILILPLCVEGELSLHRWFRNLAVEPRLRNLWKLLPPEITRAEGRELCGIVGLCLLFLYPMLLGALLPSWDFDVKEYHLGGPKEYFQQGYIGFLPHNVYTSFPFLTEMLSLCGMVLRDDWYWGALVGKAVLMGFAPLTALAVFVLGRRLAGNFAGGAAALVYLSTPWVYRISIIAYTEGAMCCYVILSLLAGLHWFEQLRNAVADPELTAESEKSSSEALPPPEATPPAPDAPFWTALDSWTLLCGLLAGSAIATKYPGLVLVALPLGLGMLGLTVHSKLPTAQISRLAGIYTVGVLLTFGPWMLKNSVETGNPFYPLAYSLFGGVDWNEELNAKWKAGHGRPTAVFKAPLDMWRELLVLVNDVTIKSDWQSVLMFGLAPLAFFFHRRRGEIGAVAAAGGVILLVWYGLTHLIDRFWVPVLPVVAVLSGTGLQALREARHSGLLPTFNWRIACGIIVISLPYNLAFMVLPVSGYNEYRIDYALARERAKPPSIQLAEQVVQDYARKHPDVEPKVLFVGEAMHFDADFAYRYNTVFDHSLLEQWTSRRTSEQSWELLPEDEILERFRSEGITHLLINWNEILRYRTTYGYSDFVSPQRLRELAALEEIVEVPLADAYNLRAWEALPDSWQQEIERWGPELSVRTPGGMRTMRQYQVFEIRHLNGF